MHSLDHFALEVPQLCIAQAFYEAFGLKVKRQGNSLELQAFGSDPCWGKLYTGKKKRLRHLCFGAYEQDMPAIERQLEAAGVPRLPTPHGEDGRGLWFHDPDQNLIQVRVAPKVTPDEKASGVIPSADAGTRGAPNRQDRTGVRPIRLSHVLIFVTDVERSIGFFEDTLGLRLSDRSRDIVAFLHAPHGADHHTLAFVKSESGGFHHCSWAVSGIDEVGLGAMQMAEAGWPEGWGVGRHVLGSNYFHYVRDPWGSYSEYSWDIDYIPATVEWEAMDHHPEDSLYLWGPDVPEDFAVNHEI
ncbi:VOC family protein [Marinobacterium aestuariivivens]|uniref:VOC family protein n=1 Tax=Marinobacterium aestuariivivens TaxID=1698799 RepID=A0ABW2A5R6_9GAMM